MQVDREKPMAVIQSGHSKVEIYADHVFKIFEPAGYLFALREVACYRMAERSNAGSIGKLKSWHQKPNGDIVLVFPKYSTTLRDYKPKYMDIKGLAHHAICILFELHCQMHSLHRDIKPHNIMMDSTGRVMCIDFSLGLACSEISPDPSDWNKYTARVITRWYRPPELLKASAIPKTAEDIKRGFGKSVSYNGSCDVWSMGLVLLQLHLPDVFRDLFVHDNERDTYLKLEAQVKTGAWLQHPDMKHFAKTLPFVYDLVVDRMLVWDPAKRATAFDLMQMRCMDGIERVPIPIEEIWMQDHAVMQRNTAGSHIEKRMDLISRALVLAGPTCNFAALVEIIDYVAQVSDLGYAGVDAAVLYNLLMAAMGYTDFDQSLIVKFPKCLDLDLGPFIRAAPLKLAIYWNKQEPMKKVDSYLAMARADTYPLGNKLAQTMALIGSG